MDFLGDPKLREKSGRYYGCWYDSRIQNEHWVSLKTGKKRVARPRLTELEEKVDDGQFDPSEDRYTGSFTLEEAANRWRDDQSEVRDGKTRNRHYVLSIFRDYICKQVYLHQLMPDDCESWIYDPPEIRMDEMRLLSRLDAFFRWCREAGDLKRNPLEEVPRPREPNTNKPQWLTRAEVNQTEIAVQHDYEERTQKYKEGAVI